MEGRRLCRLAALWCLFAGNLLPMPGYGQNLASVPSSSDTGNLSSWTNGSIATSTEDSNITVTSHFNVSSSTPPELLALTTLGFLNTTTTQSTDRVTNSSNGIPSLPNPTTKLVEANQSVLNDTKAINFTSWETSSPNSTVTETSQSEMQGPTAPQPQSSTLSTLEPMKRRQETTPVTDHEAITEESIIKSTSAPTAADGRVLGVSSSTITTSGVVSSTLLDHNVKPVKTEQPANHVQKAAVAEMGGDGEDLPNMLETTSIREDPLMIAVIFIFTIIVGIVALMGFLRYRQHSGRLQFRRLQDLPMDDMMEDTPLSLYSY
ncbi:mucin-2 isoform X2 [Anolis carolinensis]|uniref:mucin-2 isoform X2 n=1 Tax=Anolis carolinensis TaxID=28377 RepID=UPI002F2B7F6B